METTTTQTLPDWFEALSADYRAGVTSTFLLHGTIFDYVEDPEQDVTITAYLSGRLSSQFTVVCYSPDRGITFPGADSDDPAIRRVATDAESRFRAVTGLGGGEMDELERLAQQAGAGETAGGQKLPKAPSPAIEALLTFLERAYGGLQVEGPGGVMVPDPETPGDGTGMRALVIIERLDLIAPGADKGTLDPGQRALLAGLHRVGTLSTVQANENMLVMLAPSLEELHADLKQTSTGIRSIEIGAPTLEQRTAYLTRIAADPDRPLTFTDISLEEVARGTAGLGRRHIEDIALRATIQTGGVMTRELVNKRRSELMAVEYSGILEVVDTSGVTLDMVGGHELAIAYLRDEILTPIRRGKLHLVPMGAMLAGPSGTGKTFLAKGFTSELAWQMLVVRAENVKSKWLGESEAKFAKALKGIEANAPCVVFFDEVDQQVRRGAGSDGGSSVDNNMFGRLLEWLSDTSHRGQIFAIAATNRPDNLDAAFLRPGRFDAKIPLLVAQTDQERASMIQRLLKRTGDGWDCPAVATIAASTEGWTAAEYENLVTMARRLQELREIDIDTALRQAKARLKAATRDVDEMTLLALSICDDLSLVPEKWQPFVAEPMSSRTGDDDRPVGPRGGPRRARTL